MVKNHLNKSFLIYCIPLIVLIVICAVISIIIQNWLALAWEIIALLLLIIDYGNAANTDSIEAATAKLVYNQRVLEDKLRHAQDKYRFVQKQYKDLKRKTGNDTYSDQDDIIE